MVNTLSEHEIKELLIATAGLGIAFAIHFFGDPTPTDLLLSPRIIPAVVAATALTAVSYIPHEMAHRSTARVFEAYAEFRLWRTGIIIAVLSSFLGFVAAAVGGVSIFVRESERYGRHEEELSPKHIGMIAFVGPLMNIAMAVIFAFLADLATVTVQGVDLLVTGARLNAFLALFNLVPLYPLDGYKVLRWHITFWLFGVVLATLSFFMV